jgi:hypothetical protein
VLIRNHRGDFLVAYQEHFNRFADPGFTEALAIRRAVCFARDEGFDKMIFALDCLSLPQRLLSSAMDRSLVGVFVDVLLTSSRW